MAGGGVWVMRGLLHSGRDLAAALSGEAIERAEGAAVRPRHQPHAGLVAGRDAESGLGKSGPKGGGAVAGLPCRPDGLAHVRQGHALTLRSCPLAAAHGRLWRLLRGFAPNASGNVVPAGTVQFGRDRSSPTAGSQIVAEVGFQRPRDGFKPDEGPAIVQRPAIRADVGDDDVIVSVDVAASAGLSGVLPDDMRMVAGT